MKYFDCFLSNLLTVSIQNKLINITSKKVITTPLKPLILCSGQLNQETFPKEFSYSIGGKSLLVL